MIAFILYVILFNSRKLWETFISICNNENSLFGITWDSLRSQLDSMELKKNFILNPLAPEFIPGRMYHGQPAISTSNETVYENAPPPQSWFLFPFTPLQGPPIIQPAMVPAPHMMSAPHPYLNCFCPSIITPGQHPPFQYNPFNSPPIQPPPPPPPPQRTGNISSRMPSAVFPRKITNNRSSLVMDHNVPTKEFDHSLQLSRQIKRSEPQPPFPVMNKPAALRNFEERLPGDSEEILRRQFLNRIESLMHVNGQNDEHSFQNGQLLYNMEDKNKQFNIMKPDEAFNPFMKNGMPSNEVTSINSFSDHMQLRANKIPCTNTWLPFSPKTYQETDIQNMPINHNEEHNIRTPFNEMNGVANERERVRATLFNGLDVHPVMMSANLSPAVVEKWVAVHDALQNILRIELPASIPTVHLAMQEKLSLMEKVLPPGTDVLMFVDSEEQTKGFLQHLFATEGSAACKTFLMLLFAVKKDQDTILQHQKRLMAQRYSSPSRSLPDVPSVLRNIASPFTSPRSVMNNNNHMQDVMNNSETFNIEPQSTPFSFEVQPGSKSMSRMFAVDKPEPNFFNNCEQNQDFSKSVNNMANPAQWIHENNLSLNGNILLSRPVQEPPLQAMSKLSLNNQSEGRILNGDIQDDIFSSDFINRQRIQAERANELKRIWNPSEYKMSQTVEQGGSPFHLAEPGSTQGSYLSRLRSVTSSVDNGDNFQLFPFNFELPEERSPSKSRESNNHMTAGPLSMSYPDIPDILSSHILPNNKEASSKVIQKPQRSSENPATSSSPFMFDLSIQSNNDSSLRYPPLSSEGMTYAKILRSPQQ